MIRAIRFLILTSIAVLALALFASPMASVEVQEGPTNSSYCIGTQCTYSPGDNETFASSLDDLEKKARSFMPDLTRPDERYILVALQEAISAAREGNYAVGACLVNETSGEIVERGRNRVFYPYFRSDLHAEMDVLDRYEDKIRANSSRAGNLVLYVSVEPSPMGLSRIIASGVKEARYLVPNPDSALPLEKMPQTWRYLALGMNYSQANCSSELLELGYQIFYFNLEMKDEDLKEAD